MVLILLGFLILFFKSKFCDEDDVFEALLIGMFGLIFGFMSTVFISIIITCIPIANEYVKEEVPLVAINNGKHDYGLFCTKEEDNIKYLVKEEFGIRFYKIKFDSSIYFKETKEKAKLVKNYYKPKGFFKYISLPLADPDYIFYVPKDTIKVIYDIDIGE